MSYRNTVVNIVNQQHLFVGRLPRLDGAACYTNGIDPEAYFPLPRNYSAANRAAKAICKDCPVQEKCLNYALDNDIWFGIWGGLSATERNAILGKNRGYGGSVRKAVS